MIKCVLLSIGLLSSIQQIDLEFLRANYHQFNTDKHLCSSTIDKLSTNKNSQAAFLGYLGSLQTIWANHVINPFSKLSTFKTGKKNIDKSIEQDPQNVELRFIRLSIQMNAPSFLGYNSNIQEDKEFIRKHKSEITSSELLKNINTILKL